MLQCRIRQALTLTPTTTITTTSVRRSAIHRSIQVVSQRQVLTQQGGSERLETLTLNLSPTPRTLHITVRGCRGSVLDRRPHRPAALPVRTLRLALRHEVVIASTVNASQPRSDIVAADGAFEDGEGGEGLVVGDLVAGVVDAGEGEGAGLFGLAVDEGV